MKKNRYCTLKIFIKKDIPADEVGKIISYVDKLYNSIWRIHDKKNEGENPSEDEKIFISSLRTDSPIDIIFEFLSRYGDLMFKHLSEAGKSTKLGLEVILLYKSKEKNLNDGSKLQPEKITKNATALLKHLKDTVGKENFEITLGPEPKKEKPPEPSPPSHKSRYIRMPEYGDIFLSEFATCLLDNEWIQRLRFIRQTNVTFVDFPNLGHSRFQHILGTYHIGMKMMDNTDSLSQSKKIKKIDIETNMDLIFFSLCHHIFEPPFSDIGSEVICYLKNKNNDDINNAIERLKKEVEASIKESLVVLINKINKFQFDRKWKYHDDYIKKVLSPLFVDNVKIINLIQKNKDKINNELINEIIINKKEIIEKLSVGLGNTEDTAEKEIKEFLESLFEILKSDAFDESEMKKNISSLFKMCPCSLRIIDFIEKSSGLLDQIFKEKYCREKPSDNSTINNCTILSKAVISPYGLSKIDGLSMDSFYLDGNCLQGIRELIDSIFLIKYNNSYKGENKQKKFGIAIEKEKISHLESIENGRRFIAERIFHDKTLRKRRKILGRMLYRLLDDHPELLIPENYKYLVDDSVIAIFSGDVKKLEDIFEGIREVEEENYGDYGWIFGNIDDETEKKRILDYRFVLKVNEEEINDSDFDFEQKPKEKIISLILGNDNNKDISEYLEEKSDIEFYIFQLDNCDANQKKEINKKIFKNILWKKLEFDFTKRLREFEICDSLEKKIKEIKIEEETDKQIGDVFCALDCQRLTKSVFWPKGAELKNRVINNEYYYRFPSLDECNKEELEYVTFRIYVAKRNGECFDRNEDKDKDIPNKIYEEIKAVLITEYLEKEKYLVLQCDTYILDISLFASDIIDFKKFKEACHNSTSDIELKIPDSFIGLVKTDINKAAEFIIKYCEIETSEDKKRKIIKNLDRLLCVLFCVRAQKGPAPAIDSPLIEFEDFKQKYLTEIKEYLEKNSSKKARTDESKPEFKKRKYHLISFSKKPATIIKRIQEKIKDTTKIAPFSAPAWIKEYSEKKFRFIKKFINRDLFKNEEIGFYLLSFLSEDEIKGLNYPANCFIPYERYYLFDGIEYLFKEEHSHSKPETKDTDTDLFIRPQNFPLHPPLDKDEKKIVTLNDPIYGVIHLREAEYKLLKTKKMQRLSRIKQTSFVDFVYPSAIHTRLQHSLGVMYLADWAFCSIELKGEESSRIIKTEHLEEYKEYFNKARQFIRVAALIHDIGHGPLSHLSEQLITILSESKKNNGLKELLKKCSDKKQKIHEKNTEKVMDRAFKAIKSSDHDKNPIIVGEDSELRYRITNCFKKPPLKYAFLKEIASLSVGQLSFEDVETIRKEKFLGESSNDRYNYWDLRWLNPLLAGKYDVDRIDYHIRDIFFTGTNYCATDFKRILGRIFHKDWFWEVDSNNFEDFRLPDKVPFISIREDRGLV